MYVCKKCHDRDLRVTRCMTPFDHHSNHMRSKCDICGKFDMVTECWSYNFIRRGEHTKCSSVKSATHWTEE
jgi:hypothetical protein